MIDPECIHPCCVGQPGWGRPASLAATPVPAVVAQPEPKCSVCSHPDCDGSGWVPTMVRHHADPFAAVPVLPETNGERP